MPPKHGKPVRGESHLVTATLEDLQVDPLDGEAQVLGYVSSSQAFCAFFFVAEVDWAHDGAALVVLSLERNMPAGHQAMTA